MSTCGSCVHRQVSVNDASELEVSCFRYPPTVTALLVPQGGGLGIAIQVQRPRVRNDDTACGEFKESEKSILPNTDPT